ncbi:signal peptidase I [Malassezia cuniculi]|uniref:Signal peptidase complex catalytic subunit SEC11 n=1 Tax=Malassezia cuniculi TaxID=948313 RepID=A0AAF0J7I4_9BASI|nr:signal peptidase I [Malassezia cuniculi]
MFGSQAEGARAVPWRKRVAQVVQLLYVVATALAIWRGLSVVTNTESPVVVVLSGSMEPGFQRGDLLFLTNYDSPIQVGEITVYRTTGSSVPIVHRVIETHYVENKNKQILLTKGDNNDDDDIVLYNGQRWLSSDDVIGRVRGYVPYLGYATILFNDFPILKYVVLGLMGISLLFERE